MRINSAVTSVGAEATAATARATELFIAYLVEFLTVGKAATSVFFILMCVSLVDVIAGFSITITGARRDFGVSNGDQYR